MKKCCGFETFAEDSQPKKDDLVSKNTFYFEMFRNVDILIVLNLYITIIKHTNNINK